MILHNNKITNKIEINETVEDGRRHYQVIVNGTIAHEESGLTTTYNRYPTTLYEFIDYVCHLVGWSRGNIKTCNRHIKGCTCKNTSRAMMCEKCISDQVIESIAKAVRDQTL
jgi:hypothetical protein